tara:strand:+ start:35 stop:643 length:609 start_codon:yes stop_codon:yes gene_type:complete
MTEHQLNNFNEDELHMWVPAFAKDATEFEQIWLTFCFGVAQAGGPNTKYEFYSKDLGWAVGTNWGVKDQCYNLTKKFGRYIRHHASTGSNAGHFFWMKEEFDWIEVYIKKPLAQRIWIHLYNQLWCRSGFNPLLFDRSDHMKNELAHRWSDSGQGFLQHTDKFYKMKHLMVGERNGLPKYLKPKLHGNKLSNNGEGPKPKYI